METNILLENGTNELEVLEFTLGDNHYGINVAKIREILSAGNPGTKCTSECGRNLYATRYHADGNQPEKMPWYAG